MKKIALISSFCNTQEKLDVLSKNIDTIKQLGVDVLLISPISIPTLITDKCDYYFYTKDNEVLDWPIKAIGMWTKIIINNTEYTLTRTLPDHGWAGLSQIKQMSKVALSLDYDQFYHIIYDIVIDENVINGFLSDKKCNVYPSKRGDAVWPVGLHFMIFDKENLKKFISPIILENYLQNENSDAFGFLQYQIPQVCPYEIENTYVEDSISYYENHNLFDFLNRNEFNFFIDKNDKTLSNIRLLFYNINTPVNIKITIDNEENHHYISNITIIDLGFNHLNLKPIQFKINDESIDILKIINSIKHSSLTTIEY